MVHLKSDLIRQIDNKKDIIKRNDIVKLIYTVFMAEYMDRQSLQVLIMKMLMNSFIDVDKPDILGDYIIHKVAYNCSINTLMIFVENLKVDITPVNSQNQTLTEALVFSILQHKNFFSRDRVYKLMYLLSIDDKFDCKKVLSYLQNIKRESLDLEYLKLIDILLDLLEARRLADTIYQMNWNQLTLYDLKQIEKHDIQNHILSRLEYLIGKSGINFHFLDLHNSNTPIMPECIKDRLSKIINFELESRNSIERVLGKEINSLMKFIPYNQFPNNLLSNKYNRLSNQLSNGIQAGFRSKKVELSYDLTPENISKLKSKYRVYNIFQIMINPKNFDQTFKLFTAFPNFANKFFAKISTIIFQDINNVENIKKLKNRFENRNRIIGFNNLPSSTTDFHEKTEESAMNFNDDLPISKDTSNEIPQKQMSGTRKYYKIPRMSKSEKDYIKDNFSTVNFITSRRSSLNNWLQHESESSDNKFQNSVKNKSYSDIIRNFMSKRSNKVSSMEISLG